MKRALFGLGAALFLAGCSRLDSLAYIPIQTPQTWLKIQPFARFQTALGPVILVQPTTTAIVYLLACVTVAVGLNFLRLRAAQRSRFWWGIALLLWGAGALFAGTSYEAFSYAIKCAGREVCLWTSAWEIVYLLLSGASLNAMLVAEAYSCAAGKLRGALIGYALFSALAYALLILVGVFVPVRFLVSFELLILVAAPNLVIFLALNGWRWFRLKQPVDQVLLGAWAGLILTIAAYFLYYLSGLTAKLWQQGWWFSENDVLHIGLILWMLYLLRFVTPLLQDQSSPAD